MSTPLERYERGRALFQYFVQKYGRLPTEVDPDWLELLRMSKYRILAVPDVQPGKCANCGSTKQDGRKYIDVGLHIEWYGALFFCSLCMHELAKALGLFEKQDRELLELREKLAARNFLELQSSRLEETILHTFEEVKTYFNDVRADGGSTPVDRTSNVESDKTAADESGITKETSGGDSLSKDTESGTTESDSIPRRENFPKLTDLLNIK